MANEEKINLLLTDIKSLEELVSGIKHAEIYPVSFFSSSFDLSQKIIHQLHTLEEDQLEMLREQMEAHKGVINRIKESVKPTVVTEEGPSENIHPEETPLIQPAEEKNSTEVIEVIIQEATTPATAIPEEIIPIPEIANHEVTDKVEVSAPPQQEKAAISLIEVLEKKNLSDFRKAFSLNDRFRFRRELFKGDEELMNRVISDLNEIDSLELSQEYLSGQFDWDQEDEAVSDFIKLLEKRFL